MNFSASELKELFSCLPDPVFVLSETGRYVAVLGGVDQDCYQDGRVLEGKNVAQVLPEDQYPWYIEQIGKVLQQGSMLIVEYSLCPASIELLDTSIGPIGMQYYEAKVFPLSFRDSGERLVLWMAHNVSSRYQNERQLRLQSLTDELTSLYNRRHFFNQLNSALNLMQLGQASTGSLLLFDVDYFKLINDRHGHQAGDSVLRELRPFLLPILRDEDLLARVGGEEFAILLLGKGSAAALEVAERIRVETAKHVFMHQGMKMSITLSFGVAELSPTDSSDSVFGRADAALYRAKHAGRNQVVLSSASDNSQRELA
ncbi:sensor domain-containing diguanylate cyclase [Aliagarivorans marinus]|uniref:sensor domain-containing diguanylate cyclase n=1 Tax=Aliagarivorans marinus TaxID=561965 RepID=UPI000411E05A|nr:sensor domain-containing diguanylate cyclase [Aliagarivorans marinus]